jgi:hypothetical protein
MALSGVPIPQDIIDTVIGELSFNDIDTLKQCSLVSHSFLASSQKLLFSMVYFRAGYAVRAPFRQLHYLLNHSPHIISYIRELHVIVISDTPHLHSLYGEWLFNDETFWFILQILTPSLQSFSLVAREHELAWACFPFKLQSSLLDLFISPNLTSVRLINICTDRFPIETLSKLKQLKRLGIVSCSDRGCWRPLVPLPQLSQDCLVGKTHLESLELGKHISNCVLRSLMHPDSLLDISHLRTISLASKSWSTFVAILRLENMQVIQAFQSVESLMWLDSKFDETCVYL